MATATKAAKTKTKAPGKIDPSKMASAVASIPSLKLNDALIPLPEEMLQLHKEAIDAGVGLEFYTEPEHFQEQGWHDFVLNHWKNCPHIRGVILSGGRGCGKTLLVEVLAARLHKPVIVVNCTPDMRAEDLIGFSRIKPGPNGGVQDYWFPGPFMMAAKYGCMLFLNEMNYLTPAAQVAINPIIDRGERGGFSVPRTGERVVWKSPMVIADFNEGYAATHVIQDAVRDRFATVIGDYMDAEGEIKMIMDITGSKNKDLIAAAVKVANAVRKSGEIKFDFSPRALIEFIAKAESGMSVDDAWRTSVIDRCGGSARTMGTREVLKETSKMIGGFKSDGSGQDLGW